MNLALSFPFQSAYWKAMQGQRYTQNRYIGMSLNINNTSTMWNTLHN